MFANPLGCAAALASLKLLKDQKTMVKINEINQAHKNGIAYLHNFSSNIKNTRIIGTILAFELNNNYPYDINKILKAKFLENGLLIRPIGKTIYLLPPYSISKDELKEVFKLIIKIISNIR